MIICLPAAGAGSWAAANTADDPNAPTTVPKSPNDKDGAIAIQYQPNAMPNSDGLCPFGTSIYSNDGGNVTCLVKSSRELALTTWLDWALKAQKFAADTVVRLTAWGGTGGAGGAQTGSKPVAGGAGGTGGRASRTVDMTTLQSEMSNGNGRAYILVGDEGGFGETSGYGAGGGASTTVTLGTAFSSIDPTANPADTAVTLIAGGGGGGGSALKGSKPSVGYAGGAGGLATSSTSGPKSLPGGPSCQGVSGVTGANGGSSGKGGTGDVNGTGGIGGYGGGGSTSNTEWIIGSIAGPSNWTAGVGAIPKKTGTPGGGGAGGWGGGGAAPHGTNGKGACGGGGGATWAAASTVNTPATFPALGGSPNANKGAFEMYYQLPSQSSR